MELQSHKASVFSTLQPLPKCLPKWLYQCYISTQKYLLALVNFFFCKSNGYSMASYRILICISIISSLGEYVFSVYMYCVFSAINYLGSFKFMLFVTLF